MREFPFDDDGACGRGAHGSILLRKFFEAVKAVVPEATVESYPVDEGNEGLGLCAVVGLAAVLSRADDAGIFQDAEVLGDRGLRDGAAVGEHADGLFALAAEAFEERPPGGVGEGFQNGVGSVFHDNL